MVLSQPDIRKAVEDKEIVFDPPLEEGQWGQASVDLRLGFNFTRLKKDIPGVKISLADGLGTLGALDFWNTQTLKKQDAFGKLQTFALEPNEFVLAFTYEKITVPPHLIAMVEGRSTYARAGLSMHQTAPWIQPGWRAKPIVLEIINHGPLTIELTPIKDRLCQLSFLTLSSTLPAELEYGNRPKDRYVHQEHPIKDKEG